MAAVGAEVIERLGSNRLQKKASQPFATCPLMEWSGRASAPPAMNLPRVSKDKGAGRCRLRLGDMSLAVLRREDVILGVVQFQA
jgi:hypothetical protein